MFDKLYAVTQGNCIYQGPIKELVPFMKDNGLECPSYHNPADFRECFFLYISYVWSSRLKKRHLLVFNWLFYLNFYFVLFAVIEIASGEYEQIDMSKLMAAAVKKYHEERDTHYLGTFNRDNYIRADTGVYLKRDVYEPEFELMSYIYQ